MVVCAGDYAVLCYVWVCFDNSILCYSKKIDKKDNPMLLHKLYSIYPMTNYEEVLNAIHEFGVKEKKPEGYNPYGDTQFVIDGKIYSCKIRRRNQMYQYMGTVALGDIRDIVKDNPYIMDYLLNKLNNTEFYRNMLLVNTTEIELGKVYSILATLHSETKKRMEEESAKKELEEKKALEQEAAKNALEEQEIKPKKRGPKAETDSEKEPKPKKKISQLMKRRVWAKHIGEEIGKHKCLCCNMTDITQLTFNCGHIVAEAKGGELTIENLIPICQSCNSSMGTHNLNEYKALHGL